MPDTQGMTALRPVKKHLSSTTGIIRKQVMGGTTSRAHHYREVTQIKFEFQFKLTFAERFSVRSSKNK